MSLIEAAKIARNGERKLADLVAAKQWEVSQLRFNITSDLRALEKLVGREAVKDFLSRLPLEF